MSIETSTPKPAEIERSSGTTPSSNQPPSSRPWRFFFRLWCVFDDFEKAATPNPPNPNQPTRTMGDDDVGWAWQAWLTHYTGWIITTTGCSDQADGNGRGATKKNDAIFALLNCNFIDRYQAQRSLRWDERNFWYLLARRWITFSFFSPVVVATRVLNLADATGQRDTRELSGDADIFNYSYWKEG